MRIALCISGHLRHFANFKDIFYERIINVLKAQGQLDIFISTWNKVGPKESHATIDGSPESRLNDVPVTHEDIVNLFQPADYLIEEYDPSGFCLKNYTDIEPDNPGPAYKNGILSICPQYYKLWTCGLLKKVKELKEGFKYDWVIRMRPDFYPENNFPNLSELDNSKLHLPLYGDALAADWFAITNSRLYDVYSNIYINLDRIFRERFDFGGERVFYKHLEPYASKIESRQLISFIRGWDKRKDVRVVIARHSEDISWVHRLNCQYTIYNKGGGLDLPSVVQIPDMGREGYSYLQHIIRNYDNLDDYTIFCQGNPFDHCPDFVERANNFKGGPEGFWSFCQDSKSESHGVGSGVQLLLDIFSDDSAQTVTFPQAQQFAGSKERILFHNKHKYEWVAKFANWAANGMWCFSGNMERIWPTILDGKSNKEVDRIREKLRGGVKAGIITQEQYQRIYD